MGERGSGAEGQSHDQTQTHTPDTHRRTQTCPDIDTYTYTLTNSSLHTIHTHSQSETHISSQTQGHIPQTHHIHTHTTHTPHTHTHTHTHTPTHSACPPTGSTGGGRGGDGGWREAEGPAAAADAHASSVCLPLFPPLSLTDFSSHPTLCPRPLAPLLPRPWGPATTTGTCPHGCTSWGPARRGIGHHHSLSCSQGRTGPRSHLGPQLTMSPVDLAAGGQGPRFPGKPDLCACRGRSKTETHMRTFSGARAPKLWTGSLSGV